MACVLVLFTTVQLSPAQPLVPAEFTPLAVQGFGDAQNSIPWSMVWWRNRLYVGTGRATFCATAAASEPFYPWLDPYPPRNPNIECTPRPEDLPLAAEIWRWTPETDTWELLYRSPEDVELPGLAGQFVARDIGYRGMTVFTEPDGTKALYVGGVSARSLFGPELPPPRILRSEDGESFEPVPQDAGTFLGELAADGFRTLTSFDGRFYAIASKGLLGHGPVIEASRPSDGDDSFRQVTPEGLTFFEMTPYQGALYLGTGVQALNDPTPYSVFRTQATGEPPYELTTVIDKAAYSKRPPYPAVVSMQVFGGDLYVGTDRELLRIHPDDTWDLVVGAPRDTPAGFKAPLSGLDLGFDHAPNIHVWRMVTYAGRLYVGTQDQSAQWIHLPLLDRLLTPTAGFDLYASENGVDFTTVTRDGFGDPFATGVRVFADTPEGLVVGGANPYHGLELWLGAANESRPAAPTNVEVDLTSDELVLTWEAPAEAVRFHVYGDHAYRPFRELQSLSRMEAALAADVFRYVRFRPWGNRRQHFYVVAEDASGALSAPSSMVRIPDIRPAASFSSVAESLSDRPALLDASALLLRARSAAARGDYGGCRLGLAMLAQRLGRASELAADVSRLRRRVALVEAGLVSVERLLRD